MENSKALPPPVMCEVCGTYFETRRGLSSHARLHLRQLGVAISESSGSPIDLLYQIISEREGSPLSALPPVSTPPRKTHTKDKGSSKLRGKVVTTPQKHASQGSPVATARKGSAPTSPAAVAKARPTPNSSFLSPSSPLKAMDSRVSAGRTSTPSGPPLTSTKPLWAPQDTDAPLTLAMNTNDEVHVCQLCGAWYETRKGLASHARAHLRQFGVTENTETKGGPIELLYQIMDAEDLKPIGSGQQEPLNLFSPSTSSNKCTSGPSVSPAGQKVMEKGSPTSSLQPPASKRPKSSGSDGTSSILQDYRLNSGAPPKVFTCILCGEEFENRKGLASHSRSHLRQLGVTDLLGKASAIDTVQQLVSSGVLAAASPAKTSTVSPSSAPHKGPLSPPTNRAPKARKGSRLAVEPLPLPKPEPMEMEIGSSRGYSHSSSSQRWPNSASNAQTVNQDQEPVALLNCEFCGQIFDSRKALSCHARSHLRQLGVLWSVNESPIDTLQEIMLKGGQPVPRDVKREQFSKPMWNPQGPRKSLDGLSSERPSPKTFTPPLDFSLKERTSAYKNGAAPTDLCCELCGFDFENRKALASHARAHLRQLGATEWRADGAKGSPIELLSEWIHREPGKVAEIHRRYRIGDLYIKKRHAPSSSTSTDSDSIPARTQALLGLQLGRRAGREVAGVSSGGSSSRTAPGRSQAQKGHASHHTLTLSQMARREFTVRSPRGFERHVPKHPAHTENGEEDSSSQQPARSGNIPSLVPKPPLTPLVKLEGKVYSLKCRFCEEVFHGPLSIQEDWIRHLQKHILNHSYNKPSPPPTPGPDNSFVPGITPSTINPTPTPQLLGPVAV